MFKNNQSIEEQIMLLWGENVGKNFGGLAAVSNLDFAVNENEILGLIGPNGAGKTTLFNLIMGYYKPDSGKIFFKDEDITGLRTYKVCKKGIGRTFQIPKPFLNTSVLENCMVGGFFGVRGIKNLEEARLKAQEILELTDLLEKKDMFAKNLTLIERKKLEFARALSTSPEILLLDEVVAGLNPTETEEMMDFVNKIRDSGITIFMIEHIMKAVMGVSDRIIVLHHGEKIAEGSPEEVASDQKVIEAYLGERII